MSPHQGPLRVVGRPEADAVSFRLEIAEDGYCGWLRDGPAPATCTPSEVIRALGPHYRNAVLTMTEDACQALRERAFAAADGGCAQRLRRSAQVLRAALSEAVVLAA